MRRPSTSGPLLVLLLLAVIAVLPGELAIWRDADGNVTLSNRDPGLPPGTAPGAARISPEDLALEWQGKLAGEPLARAETSSSLHGRYERALLAARDDLRRGELKAGLYALRRLVRDHPQRPEAALLLARVERARGRLHAARDALDRALGLPIAGPSDVWQLAAARLKKEIETELAHAEQQGVGNAVEPLSTEHFVLRYDHFFAGRDYGDTVIQTLEQVRGEVGAALGRGLERALEVRVYTRAQYLDAYQHRFGFATVGFYDGAIHVVSARHPRGELTALLTHEYVHAVFQDVVGGHQPFFLNEGIAEREEERVRGRPRLVRGEWRQLLDAVRDGGWVPLRSLVPGFGGVKGSRALLAYLESRAAVELLETRWPGFVGRWLDRIERGAGWERALRAETGLSVEALESALQAEVRGRFPRDPLARLRPGQDRQSSGA